MKYGTTKKCLKCGEARHSGGSDGFKVEYLPNHNPPVMRITCSRCGFQFFEKPLDRKAEEVEL